MNYPYRLPFLLPFFVLAHAVQASSAAERYSFVSGHAFGKNYTISISHEAIDNSPAWNEADENPPVSARTALKLASEVKDSLVNNSADYEWRLSSLELRSFGDNKWCWVASFHASTTKPGRSNSVPIGVMMDGMVIRPKVTTGPPARPRE